MLIRFHVSNYLSFKDEIELSMVPGKSRGEETQILETECDSVTSLLRAAIIYGANASGKSNLVKAMQFAQRIILNGTKAKEAISVSRFKLDSKSRELPSKFEFEFISSDRCYIYGFELDTHRIHEEWLYEILKTTEKMLFERSTDSSDKTVVEFGKLNNSNKKRRDFLDFVAMSTRPNQLFLTESAERNVVEFESIDHWFREKLEFIFPDTKWIGLAGVGTSDEMSSDFVEHLEYLATGICGFKLVEVDPEDTFPREILDDFHRKTEDRDILSTVIAAPDDSRYLLEYRNGKFQARKLMFRHQMADSKEKALFSMDEESDGTRRIMDLLPFLAGMPSSDKVYVIDEIDRSLHPLMSYQLIKLFLSNVSSQSQLISTTHEINLLDQKLLRRDEIWFVEKDNTGASHIYSLEEYAPRKDKKIERGYLMGRYGAIPVFGDISFKKSGHE